MRLKKRNNSGWSVIDMNEPMKNAEYEQNGFKVKFFAGDKPLSEHTDSLLFNENEMVAEMVLTDAANNRIDLWLGVRGEKAVYMLDENGEEYDDGSEYDGVFNDVEDYPEELVRRIKAGNLHDSPNGYLCSMNNWYECIYTETSKGEKDVYSDGEVWEGDLSDQTEDGLKKEMFDYGEYLFQQAYERGEFEKPSKTNKKER
jgi:hypothetical protein